MCEVRGFYGSKTNAKPKPELTSHNKNQTKTQSTNTASTLTRIACYTEKAVVEQGLSAITLPIVVVAEFLRKSILTTFQEKQKKKKKKCCYFF